MLQEKLASELKQGADLNMLLGLSPVLWIIPSGDWEKVW